jgi:hypothetical protein
MTVRRGDHRQSKRFKQSMLLKCAGCGAVYQRIDFRVRACCGRLLPSVPLNSLEHHAGRCHCGGAQSIMRRTATDRAWTTIYEDRIQALQAEVSALEAALEARGDDAARSWWVAWNATHEYIAAIYGTAATELEMQTRLDTAAINAFDSGHLQPIRVVLQMPRTQSAKPGEQP